MLDRKPNAVDVGKHVIVPEPDHAETLSFEIFRPGRIPLSRVLAAVDLDDQTVAKAEEVDDVAVDLHLATKLQAMHLAAAEILPEGALGVR